MQTPNMVFIAGHHRSGTSLLHEILSEHSDISGLKQTGAPEDEGQHLQSVFEAAKECGGPGKYIFNPKAYMDDAHPLCNDRNSEKIWLEWQRFYEADAEFYIEKSPPNLIRTRFFQKLFPASIFIVILRHPLAVGYATQKWSHTSIRSLLEHTMRGYEIFASDLLKLNKVYVLRYEDFVQNPQLEIDKLYRFIGVKSRKITHNVLPTVNDKYFKMWERNRGNWLQRLVFPISTLWEQRANRFGYSLIEYRKMLEANILGQHVRN